MEKHVNFAFVTVLDTEVWIVNIASEIREAVFNNMAWHEFVLVIFPEDTKRFPVINLVFQSEVLIQILINES